MDPATASEPRSGAQADRPLALPSVSLPKGGGAIRGVGEKFAANPVTGTGSMTVPIATSPSRSGFGPELALAYDSGSGNGPFGFGWSLGLPAITRKTDDGLPRYDDRSESDVYMISGAEDLVPVLQPDGHRHEDRITAPGYVIHRYRPRIEGLFSRIERWTDTTSGEIHWRTITRDNVTALYGTTDNCRIFDPVDRVPPRPRRIFSWLIHASHDDKGNAILYGYAGENDANVDRGRPNERNRVRTANRYIKRIKYGNREPNRNPASWKAIDPTSLPADTWMFEVVFDYDEGHYETLAPLASTPVDQQHTFVRAAAAGARSWSVRPDPFSIHRAGFEVRTYRRCLRVLMFHHIPDLPTGEKGYDGLVRSIEFDYADLDYARPVTVDQELAHQGSSRYASLIRAITQSGYARDESRAATYLKKSIPPVEFEYSRTHIHDEVLELDAASLQNLPIGLDGATYRLVDLDGEGVPGILSEQADGWFYKPNRGDAQFGALRQVALEPSLASLTAERQELLDLEGDGQLDLVAFAATTPGFYERTPDQRWNPFRTFRRLPNIPWNEPNLRFVDLDGDGRADVLITEQDVFTWHPSLGEQGFGAARRVHQPFDEERGPKLVHADGTLSIFLADMCGDGLADLVRIRNGEVCYWPNLGYGRFGPKVTMDNAPRFDAPDQFDQRRIRLIDADGSGTSDIAYLRDGVQLYFNEAGNRLSAVRRLENFPPIDNLATVTSGDLLGNGTGCLVWSSPLPSDARRALRYVDLMGGVKPHLLLRSVNNLGGETEIEYTPSTKFYLADKRNGRPWVSRLPFPVHVVERVVTRDRISGNRFVTRYAYHHGAFDGTEREFAGFGLVEQWDTEEFSSWSSDIPPALTRTWFHTGSTGAALGFRSLEAAYAAEYYREPARTDDALLLEDTRLPDGLNADEVREACRALKGSMLRQEMFALDGSAQERYPFSVVEQNFTVRRLQPRGENRHAVFFTHPRESISYHYERNPQDPRTSHALTLAVDDFGNVLRSASIGYGRRETVRVIDDEGVVTQIENPGLRRLDPGDRPKQRQLVIILTENRVTKSHDAATEAIDAADDYRRPLRSESRSYELTGLVLVPDQERFTFDAILQAAATATPLDYEKAVPPGLQKRLIEHVRTYYRRDDLSGALPLGAAQPLALPFESYKLAFTSGLAAQTYPGLATDAMFADEGRYVHTEGDGHWWIPSGTVSYSPGANDTPAVELAYARRHFFLPLRHRDPFHTPAVSTERLVTYDAHDLLVEESRDPLGNLVTAGERGRPATPNGVIPRTRGNDYRVLQPAVITDPNRNRSMAAFDALGMVVGTADMGKPAPEPIEGDSLNGFVSDLTQAQIDQLLAAPTSANARALLGSASARIVYDFTAYQRSPDPMNRRPSAVATIARETRVSELNPNRDTRVRISITYSDGFGREVQSKLQAEPGPVPARDGNGRIVTGTDGQPQMIAGAGQARWVGTGWTVFNNKSKPVRQFEPFFTDTARFEFDVRIGVSPILFYDPIGRSIGTLHPNHSWGKRVFDSWHEETWDVNDTVLADPAADPHLGGWFRRLPDAEYLPTWYALRTNASHAAAANSLWPDPGTRDAEARAARSTAMHAATQTVAHLDSLGRSFLTIAHNRFKRTDTQASSAPTEEFHATHVDYDVEGNQRQIVDARDRATMQYDYDMRGIRVHQISMDAGERWTLADVSGKPLRGWDARGHAVRAEYDPLRRQLRAVVSGPSAPRAGEEFVSQRMIYGEQHPDAEVRNLRGALYLHLDQAGVTVTERNDFSGNGLSTTRRFAVRYDRAIDWRAADAAVPARADALLVEADLEAVLALSLEPEAFTSSTRWDALSRPIQLIAPHTQQAGATVSVIQPVYNEANLLEQVQVWYGRSQEPAQLLDPATADLDAVTDIDYNAKGQRLRIDRGTRDGRKISTRYAYDPRTFRLRHLYTRRGVDPITRQSAGFNTDCDSVPASSVTVAAPDVPPPGTSCGLQNLRLTYDPSGNVTSIRDAAQQPVYFNNVRVTADGEYLYDAIYRLIEASGREHLGQNGAPLEPHAFDDARHVRWTHPADGTALARYLERYTYDPVGNIVAMQHEGTDPAHPGWTRTFTYAEESAIEPTARSNRLTSTSVGATTTEATYGGVGGYDPHGNLLRMPHLPVMHWDFRDQLQMTQHQAVNESNEANASGPERTWYVYDSSGQRVRKVTEDATGQMKEERLYLGAVEIFRRYGVNPLVRETLHVMDDKQRIAAVHTRTAGNEAGIPVRLVRYQFDNHLGSTCLELDDAARIVSYEEYTPYGSTALEMVSSQTESPNRYRYTGKERDDESGFYYYGRRYLAPWLGRWVSCDPGGAVDGVNLYQYVGANPMLYRDDTGMAKKKPQAQFGDIKQYSKQGSAIREAGKRMSEHEHLGARINWDLQTRDPVTGLSPYDDGAYRRSTTLTIPEDMARTKTRADMALRDELKQLNGAPLSESAANRARPIESDIERTIAARDETMKARKAAGKSIDDLASITDEKIIESAHLQGSELHDVGKRQSFNFSNDDLAKWEQSFDRAIADDAPKSLTKVTKASTEVLEKSGKGAKGLAKVAKAGRHLAAAIPILGMVAGQASAAHAASQGDYTGAALDEVGFIPVVGDVVDAARGGYALGEAANEFLVDDDLAMKHGDAAKAALERLGGGETLSTIAGGLAAAGSAVGQVLVKASPMGFLLW